MRQNSFQKNGMLNMSPSKSSYQLNPDKLGRRTIQEIRDDMAMAKTNRMGKQEQLRVDKQSLQRKEFNQRIDKLKNFNRWK